MEIGSDQQGKGARLGSIQRVGRQQRRIGIEFVDQSDDRQRLRDDPPVDSSAGISPCGLMARYSGELADGTGTYS